MKRNYNGEKIGADILLLFTLYLIRTQVTQSIHDF